MGTATRQHVPTREESARVIAKNAVPEIQEALKEMRVIGDVTADGMLNGHGLVHIILCSGDAYAFARWVRARVEELEKDDAEAKGTTRQ